MKIVVVGFGRFGKVLAELIYNNVGSVQVCSKGLQSSELDSRFELVTIQDLSVADVVVLAVPISSFEESLHSVIPHLKKGAVLIDVCSVKVFPAKLMMKHVPSFVDVLATHPMWGPESIKINNGVAGLKIVLCPLRLAEIKLLKIRKRLEDMGFEIIIETPADHDRKAASSQALTQFVGKILEIMPLEDVDISTLGYDKLKGLLPFVENSSKELFYDLQNYNPFASSVRKRFMEIALLVSGDINKKDLKKGVSK